MRFDDKKLRELESKVLAYRFRDKDMEDRKTYDEVFDHSTLLTIYDMMTNGFFDISFYRVQSNFLSMSSLIPSAGSAVLKMNKSSMYVSDFTGPSTFAPTL